MCELLIVPQLGEGAIQLKNEEFKEYLTVSFVSKIDFSTSVKKKMPDVEVSCA